MPTISRNVSGAVIFLGISLLILIYDVVGHYANPEWGAETPMFLHDMMPFMFNVGVPAIFVLGGVAAFYALYGERGGGFIGIILIGALAGIWNIFPTIWRLQAGEPYGAAICVFEMIAAGMSVRYAIIAMHERGSVTRPANETASSKV